MSFSYPIHLLQLLMNVMNSIIKRPMSASRNLWHPCNSVVPYYCIFCLMLYWLLLLSLLFNHSMQHQGFFRNKSVNTKIKVMSTAEKKLLFVFAYYIIYAVIVLVFYSVSVRDLDRFVEASREYFFCEAGGYNPEDPCPRTYEQYKYPYLQSTVYIVLGFIPAVNLIFVVNIQRLKEASMPCFQYATIAFSKSPPPSVASFNGRTYTTSTRHTDSPPKVTESCVA